ncbi:EAL domain-containing protein [Halarcobacter sp.]|uniref:EAL domain-containing response regulator n=1 Tax=Halarcobacter sp. TaxID=2321133 RepID=UPI003A95304C
MVNKLQLENLINEAKDIKVLYVEDDYEVRLNIAKLLETIFPTVILTENGQEALDIFKEDPTIDLIITDINMPVMNGISFIKEARKINFSIPSIIITAQNDRELINDAIIAGIDGFILKPLELDQLYNALLNVINKCNLIKENDKNIAILNQYKDITNKSSIISKTDPTGMITYVNDNFCEISGYSEIELVGRPHNIVRHPDNPKELFANLWKTIKKEKKPWTGIIKNLTKDGKSYFVKSTIKPIFDNRGEIVEYMALRDDITQIMSEKKQLIASLESCSKSFLALIQIENFDILDKFYDTKSVEKIETTLANAIVALLPKDGQVFEKIYKLGDGLFALSCDYTRLDKAQKKIENILSELIINTKQETIKLDNIEYDISLIVSYCVGEKNLFENAKYGIERAVETNMNLIFANNLVDEAQKNAQKNIETIHMVKKALDNFKIISYFQPIIDNQTKQTIKYESLVRLINEEGETVSPFFFLDVSKKGAYYTKITNRVIESSFNVLDHIEHNVSINLSVLDIENNAIRNKLIELVSKDKYKGRVTFELLEDENIKDFNTVKNFISDVKKAGDVKIAIDDFGSGYSNFERLLEYTPDILKIDGSLIKNIETDSFSRNLVETIVTFAKKQNIKTIAEYVENEEIYNILNEIGVDYSQGYYFGKPEKLI